MTSALPGADHDSLELHRILASALAGRPVEVVAGRPGKAAWSDGSTITVDPAQDSRHTIEAVVVHAALIGAGSLAGDLMRPLLRRRRLRRRFLHIEGPRAVAGLQALLPRSLNYMVCESVAELSASPISSLALARSRNLVPESGLHLGTIRPRKILSALRRTSPTALTPTAHETNEPPGAGGTATASAGPQDTSISAPQSPSHDHTGFFSGDGGLTLAARLLRALLRGAGRPGADGPVGGWRSSPSRRVAETRADSEQVITEELGTSPPIKVFRYPEWDNRIEGYRREWCTVRVDEPDEYSSGSIAAADLGMRRPLSRLGTGPQSRRRQSCGYDIDIDAAIENRVRTHTSPEPDEDVYLATVRDRRDLSALILLDVSGSANEPGVGRVPIHDHQRAAVAALATTLHRLGDRVAVYAFSSHGRHNVRLTALKTFAEHHDRALLARLYQLQPSGYSRLGAAIRHGAKIIEQGGTTRRLLVVVSDGLAFDHGYNLDRGAHDVQRALTELRGKGVGCLCLTVGSTGPSEDLRRVFGAATYASVPRADQLASSIFRLCRSALKSADIRRNQHSLRGPMT